MKILVTAGNTQTPIDRVRCITNIFTGRTGAQIALHAHSRGHDVQLVTSHPEVVNTLKDKDQDLASRWRVCRYQTFDDLREILESSVCTPDPDAVVHCAAVSDFRAAGVFAPTSGSWFDEQSSTWQAATGGPPALMEVSAAKVKSNAPELWLRLVPTPKLVDLMRSEWGFRGVLVKFKLEVGVPEARLLEIAERSRAHSAADLMVANTLEGSAEWALLGPRAGAYHRVSRADLPGQLLDAIEEVHREIARG